MSTNILETFVEFKMINLVSGELKNIMKGLLGVDNATINAMKNMTSFKAMVVGVGAVAFGTGILAGMYQIAKAGGELEQQLGAIKAQYADITDAQTNQIRQFALRSSGGSSGATPSEVAEGFGENFTIFKDFKEALSMTPETVKLKTVIAGMLGKTFDGADDDYKKLLKSVELHGDTLDPKTGLFSVDRAKAALEDKERLMISTRGMATSADILNVEKQGSTVLRTMDYEKADRFVAGVIQAFGGFRAGTAIQAMGKQLYGGKMTEATANEMERIGLMQANGYTKRKGGGIDLKSGALTGQGLLDKGNVQDYITKVVAPALHKAFLKEGRKGESEAVFDAGEITKISSTAPFARFLTEWVAQSAALLKEGKGIDMTQTVDQQKKTMLATSIPANIENFDAAWKSLMQALGWQQVGPVIGVIQTMTKAITWLKDEIVLHPNASKILLELAAGLGAVMIVVGGVVAIAGAMFVLAAIPAAPIIALVLGIGTAIAALGVVLYANWEIVKKYAGEYATWFVKSYSGAYESLKTFLGGVVTRVEGIWTTLQGALMGFFDRWKNLIGGIAQWVHDHIPHFMGGGSNIHQESYRYDPSQGNRLPIQHIHFNIDGREVSHVVLEHAANEMSRNNSGTSGWNSRSGYMPPGQISL